MAGEPAIFAADFKETPFWWEAAPRPQSPQQPLPSRVDVAIVGAGHTGLVAALTLARAGRSVAVFDAGDPGQGASSRNAGFIGRTLKHGFGTLIERHGLERAIAVYRDMRAAFDSVFEIVEREQLNCRLVRCGRFMAALSPRHYDWMARDLELKQRHLGEAFEMVPRAEQRREIGTDFYHGGAVIADHGALHPGLYHLELLDRVIGAGAQVLGRTPVAAIRRESDGFAVATPRGTLAASNVLVATNGYTGPATPWLRRRVIPFHGYMIATESLAPGTVAAALPRGRICHDYNHNILFMRPSPDGDRILVGGFTGGPTRDLRRKAARLHARLSGIFPELQHARLSHAWTGKCAATFDLYPHVGLNDGVHFALGYCFAGLPMGTWLGRKAALKIMGAADAATAFDRLEFPTMPLYSGNPWFVPLAMKYYDWQDRRSL